MKGGKLMTQHAERHQFTRNTHKMSDTVISKVVNKELIEQRTEQRKEHTQRERVPIVGC